MAELTTVSILGCGWYGMELAKALITVGYQVKGSVTSSEKLRHLSAQAIQPFLVNFEKDAENYDALFFKTDVLFICIPPKRAAGLQSDYPYKIRRILNAAKHCKIKHIVFISSTAVYGDTNAELNELNSPAPETDSGKAVLEAETLLQNQKDITITIIRFAGLVGPGRDPGRFFSGKTDIPNGQAPVNLIHLNDCIGFSLNLMARQAYGHTFNACCPHHPAKQEFYTAAAQSANLTTPVFKDELLKWKVISSIHLPLLNYTYQVTNWISWLNTRTNY
ncbi:nucleoside-diphosphate-sugar epimerase [Pedobacter africanus]|uniref:Nucleoside-diphosphate-sugar epimerase n=1 Tax=Pedobacter africanus TaxID=151894 RepID=A0ACC6KTF7_9SPHI|nr:SDR family oxidoreductase [Pedobacter africanus]MDR6782502.1 nucleoside-diphosphate-sugar epimerase [Pedobacter africanus]